MNEFKTIKQQIQQLIYENQEYEVTTETQFKTSGIYMIYLNCFIDDLFIPIYIGQSKNVQRRYKEHYMELLALNRLSVEEYKKYFFEKPSSFYEGKFKICKIFNYMIENDCTLADFRMVLLEETEPEVLNQKERQYFERYRPSIFGFNQLNSFLTKVELAHSPHSLSEQDVYRYLDDIRKDTKLLKRYIDYGYARFNFEQAYPRNFHIIGKEVPVLNAEITAKMNEIGTELLNLWRNEYTPLHETMRLIEQQQEDFRFYQAANEALESMLDELRLTLEKRFRKMKLYSKKAQEDFINSIMTPSNAQCKKDFLYYMEKKGERFDFHQFYRHDIVEIQKKQVVVNEKENIYEVSRDAYLLFERENRTKRYQMIFPKKDFGSFHLRDRKVTYDFSKSTEYALENTCEIRFVIANNRLTRSAIRKEPYIVRVDVKYTDATLTLLEQSLYVKNEITQKIQKGLSYVEADFYKMFLFKSEPFKITCLNEVGQPDNTFISTLAEYKHGINDYTVKGKSLYPLSLILTKIEQQTNCETKFKIVATESFPCLVESIENEKITGSGFAEKIIHKKLKEAKIIKGNRH